MIKTRLRRVGDSAVMILTEEMLAVLSVKEGDPLYVIPEEDGSLRIMAQDPELAAAMAAAEVVMEENSEMLAALA